MSASIGKLGGARAQYHLRQTFVFLNMHPINRPEVMLSDAAHNVDENGKVTNEADTPTYPPTTRSTRTWTIQLKQKPQLKLPF